MGCHTWCYERIDLIEEYKNHSIEEIKSKIIFSINDIINMFNEWIEEEEEEHPQDYNNALRYHKRILNWVNTNKISKKETLLRLFVRGDDSSSKVKSLQFNNKLYYCKEVEYHDIFRNSEYLEDVVLLSEEDTLDFIKNHKCSGGSYMGDNGMIHQDVDYKEISEFWKKYPLGLIEFG